MDISLSMDWRAELAKLDAAAARWPAGPAAVRLLAAHGRLDAAVAVYRVLERRRHVDSRALREIAAVLSSAGRRAELRAALDSACRREADQMGLVGERRDAVAAYLLARELGEAPPKPRRSMCALFDRVADNFDDLLLDRLEYRGPQILMQAIRARCGAAIGGWRVLDAGCGTGLAAELLRPIAARLEGVDLSPRMVERASRLGLYDRLTVNDLETALAEGAEHDLIFAADVLCYVGTLDPVLAACRQALAPSGWIALTVEAAQGSAIRIGPSGRFAHGEEYLRSALRNAGFERITVEPAEVRCEATKPVASFAALAAVPDARPQGR